MFLPFSAPCLSVWQLPNPKPTITIDLTEFQNQPKPQQPKFKVMTTITGLAAIGAGLAAMGAGMGIARQPEAAPKIQTAMIIAAALIEGVALFAVVVALLVA
jgi:F-type H+-transporting ATPase subunit c